MDSFLKKAVVILFFIAGLACITSLHAQNAGELAPAPEFEIYQYEDEVFSTGTVYGKKIVTFVFGSIT